jgi:hypothetical protein
MLYRRNGGVVFTRRNADNTLVATYNCESPRIAPRMAAANVFANFCDCQPVNFTV